MDGQEVEVAVRPRAPHRVHRDGRPALPHHHHEHRQARPQRIGEAEPHGAARGVHVPEQLDAEEGEGEEQQQEDAEARQRLGHGAPAEGAEEVGGATAVGIWGGRGGRGGWPEG